MRQLFHAEGILNRDFVGQITYTVCLEKPCRAMDIAMTFDRQHFSEEDITPEMEESVLLEIRENYGLSPGPCELRRMMLQDMKTEIHLLAMMNDTFIGCIHRQLTERHMHFENGLATEGCLPVDRFEGVLQVTVLVFNVIMDGTRYTLSVSGEEDQDAAPV